MLALKYNVQKALVGIFELGFGMRGCFYKDVDLYVAKTELKVFLSRATKAIAYTRSFIL